MISPHLRCNFPTRQHPQSHPIPGMGKVIHNFFTCTVPIENAPSIDYSLLCREQRFTVLSFPLRWAKLPLLLLSIFTLTEYTAVSVWRSRHTGLISAVLDDLRTLSKCDRFRIGIVSLRERRREPCATSCTGQWQQAHGLGPGSGRCRRSQRTRRPS